MYTVSCCYTDSCNTGFPDKSIKNPSSAVGLGNALNSYFDSLSTLGSLFSLTLFDCCREAFIFQRTLQYVWLHLRTHERKVLFLNRNILLSAPTF